MKRKVPIMFLSTALAWLFAVLFQHKQQQKPKITKP